MDDHTIFVRAALAYARRGWQVVPLNQVTSTGGCTCQRGGDCKSQGKHPRVRWKEHGGSVETEQIMYWWRRWPRANVAILTGLDRSGLFVIDVDPRHGGDATLDALQEMHGQLPDTLTAITGSGGRHILYRRPEQGAKQGAGDLGPGLDTRSDGGLIVAAPSVHHSGGSYRWQNWGTGLAEVPPWVLNMLRLPEPVARVSVPRRAARGFMDQVLADKARSIATAPAGQRNNTLNAVAYYLGTLVAADVLDQRHVEDELLTAAVNAGLGETESRDTINSGLTDGMTAPSKRR